jgi:hypothetical protein
MVCKVDVCGRLAFFHQGTHGKEMILREERIKVHTFGLKVVSGQERARLSTA